MKFQVRKDKSFFTSEYEVRLSEATRKAVRKTAVWTGATAAAIGLAVMSDKIKRHHKDSVETPEE